MPTPIWIMPPRNPVTAILCVPHVLPTVKLAKVRVLTGMPFERVTETVDGHGVGCALAGHIIRYYRLQV